MGFVAGELRYAIGRNLRSRRDAEGLTQESFALRYGLDRALLGRVENAHRNLTIKSIEGIADKLNMDVFVLVSRPPEPSAGPLAEPAEDEADEEEAGE